jgi:hypothetical protein
MQSDMSRDTDMKVVFVKEIKPMVIDSTWKVKKELEYKQLENSQDKLRYQHKMIDSLMINKTKK